MPNLVQAFEAPFSPAAPDYENWEKYQRSKVSGATLMYQWNEVEAIEGQYDFSKIDARLNSFPGMKVGVVFAPQSLYTGQQWTPAYVLREVPESQIASCDGISSIVPWNQAFALAWRNFVKAAIEHYNLPSSPKLTYARFGLYRGDQASMQCVPQLEAIAGSTWALKMNWINAYTQIVTTIFEAKPSFPVQQEVAYGPNIDVTYCETEASICTAHGIGIGDGGFNPDDMSSKNPSSDWVSLFRQYQEVPVLRELQPLSTGFDLAIMLPFAKSNYCNVLELQMDYVSGAFNPGGNSAWATAIEQFME
jgi:hypothetical protein